ncbi:MAG: hypothetical protein JRN59_06035 [Nitrososphaerota archaeon]|jgi:hypothetical protein|nr:hypothetical protein [Nitrososphaerota archaeon]
MSADYEAASTLSVLLGIVLGMVLLGKHADDIIYAVDSFVEWVSSNVVGILAFFFLISLFATALAAMGIV